MKHKKVIVDIILIVVIMLFITSCVRKDFQNDTFFTIALGERTVEYGIEENDNLVWHDDLNFIHLRWLFDVIVYEIYITFGFVGVYVFTIIIAVIQGLLYYYIVNKFTNNKFLAFIFTICTMFFIKGEFAARGQIVSFTLFLLEFYCIEQLLKTDKKRYIVMLLIIPVIIVNCHASVFPVYFVFYLPYVAEFILSKVKLKKNEDSKIIIENRKITKLIILMICGILLGFCSPIGVDAYKYMFTVMEGISTEIIEELQPIDLFKNIYYTALICLAIGLLGFTKTKVRLTDCLFILGFLLLSLPTHRCIFFFYLIASICIIRILNDFLKDNNFKIEIKNNKIKELLLTLILLCIILISINMLLTELSEDYVDTELYPENATIYMLANLDIDNMKIFNHFNFGSYLELNGIKVFIDSRSEMYTSEFNETTVLSDWHNVTNGLVNYKTIFNQYEITHALLYKVEVINQYICDDPEWKVIYQDDVFVLYEKVEIE